MHTLTPLFDEILRPAFPAQWVRNLIRFVAWLTLRRLYSRQETEETEGISGASGVDLYFLVALNVLLDSMLGCTSGAALTRPRPKGKGEGEGEGKRMLHFRTLDWGMDCLRRVLVELEFVRSQSADPERVVARTITYAGFVGVLTGVRYVCV